MVLDKNNENSLNRESKKRRSVLKNEQTENVMENNQRKEENMDQTYNEKQ